MSPVCRLILLLVICSIPDPEKGFGVEATCTETITIGGNETKVCNQTTCTLEFQLIPNTTYIEIKMEPGNFLLHCNITNSSAYCTRSDAIISSFNEETQGILNVSLTNLTYHNGKNLSVTIYEKHTESDACRILFKICGKGFHSMALHDGKNVTVSCEHSLYNISKGTIAILLDKNIAANCNQNVCTPAARVHALPCGMQYTRNYTEGMTFVCEFDGKNQSVEIIQQTTARTTTTTKKVSSTVNTGNNPGGTGSSRSAGQSLDTCTLIPALVGCLASLIMLI